MTDHPDIAWLCVSDLHLGGRTSLLTNVDDDGEPDLAQASEVAIRLADALRHLVAGQRTKPRLVLLGDVMELALMPPGTTLMALQRFLQQLTRDEPVIDPEVWYLPGNHDHHVWEVAREEMYAAYVTASADEEQLLDAWHVSAMTVVDGLAERMPLRGRPTTPALLQAAGRRAGGLRIRVVYPNLAVPGEAGRVAVFHHGHLTEPIYTLMTTLREAVFPQSDAERAAARQQFWRLEEDNCAWIEFLWSGLGRSGATGGAVSAGFEMLGDDLATRALADRVADVSLQGLRDRHPHLWQQAAIGLSSPVARSTITNLAERIRDRERFAGGVPFGARLRAGVLGYLEAPLLAQHRDECAKLGLEPAASLTFVFGHTHKPFATTTRVPGWREPARLLNTGGWVVDSDEPHAMTGGAVVMLDHHLDAVALHVSSQSANPANHIVRLEAPEADPTTNPLWRSLDARVDPGAAPWRELAEANAAEVVRRRAQITRRLAASIAAVS